MKGLIQRVSSASVRVDNKEVGAIDNGMLLLLGVDTNDDREQVEKLAHKVLNYRIFPDDQGKMNRSVLDTGGGVLVVSQFTLSANTDKGLRPSFSSAAPPTVAEHWYEQFVALLTEQAITVATGVFGADMKVSLVNDGPVTFVLEV